MSTYATHDGPSFGAQAGGELGLATVHRLFGIGLELRALSLRQPDPNLALHLERFVGELDVAIDEVRAVVFSSGQRDE